MLFAAITPCLWLFSMVWCLVCDQSFNWHIAFLAKLQKAVMLFALSDQVYGLEEKSSSVALGCFPVLPHCED